MLERLYYKAVGKQNVLFVIPIRRLYTLIQSSGLLEEMKSKYQVSLLIPKDAFKVDWPFVSYYNENRFAKELREILLNVETMKKANSVISFETRIRETLGLQIDGTGIYKLSWARLFFFWRKPRVLAAQIMYLLTRFTWIHRALRSSISLWPSIKQNLKTLVPDGVVVFSGGAFTGIENSIFSICRKIGVPSVLIVDNWDNLSSKSVIWNSPDGLGVWGPNMLRDALDIHNMTPRICRSIGSARFRPNERQIKPIEDDFVFFAGSGKPVIDEVEAVHEIRGIMNRNSLNSYKIIYRPHPMSAIDIPSILDSIRGHEGIEFDDSLGTELKDSFYKEENLRSLEMLCKYAKVVIAPTSSIIVESLSVGTPVVSLNWSRKFGEQGELLKYTHFYDVIDVAGFFIANSWEEFEQMFLNALAFEKRGNLVPTILPSFTSTYASRVQKLIKQTAEI